MSDAYTFGDSDRAAQRLALLATVFAPTSEAFLRVAAPVARGLAVDLGTGPGHTAELIAATLNPHRLVAIESSAPYVGLARRRLGSKAEVLEADVRALPQTVRAADLIYARMLLTHLADPLTAVAAWCQRLGPGGVLALEEVDSIDTEDPVLAGYLDLQREMLRAHGHTLDVGPLLDGALSGRPGVRSTVAVNAPDPVAAARMFALNFESWRHRPEVTAAHSDAELDDVAAALAAHAASRTGSVSITWRMRQLTIAAG